MNKLISCIKKIPKTYVTFSDLLKISSLDLKSLKVAVSRLVKNGELKRIRKGIYSLEPSQIDWEKFALECYRPSYLSFESALARHNVLSQKPHQLTLATSLRSRKVEIPGKEIVYHHLQPGLMWGYFKKEDILLADPEKALLDLAYLAVRGKAKIDLEEINMQLIDRKKLEQYIAKFNDPRLTSLFS